MFKGNFGIEKETLRVSRNGHVVSTPHPIGDANSKFKNPHITVDFSEQQVEVITGVNSSVAQAVEELKLLTNIFYRSMNEGEYLWNYSMPYGSTKGSTIALGDCPATDYRKQLLLKSSFDMQLISGIHFNFSFDEEFLKDKSDNEVNSIYFKIAQNYARVSFVIKHMFGMSPTKDFKNMDMISHRQSRDGGYHNNNEDLKCFCNHDSYDKYNEFIRTKIDNSEIDSFREVYTNIRMKPFEAERIQWVEVRNIDLDYTEDYGVSVKKLEFLHMFLLFLAFTDSTIAEEVHDLEQTEFDFEDTLRVLEEMKKWMISKQQDTTFLDSYINKMKLGNYDAQEVPVLEEIINKQLLLRKEINKIPLNPIEDMELSTQILIEEAYKSGMPVHIVDRVNDKVKIKNTILEMATLNPFDSKEGLEIIDSKVKTNNFLKENNFSSTEQNLYHDAKEAFEDFDKFEGKKIVVKPVNTNFSKGLSVFENGFNQNDFNKAIEFAFSFDDSVLVEKFVSGQEYRFLVIDDKLIGILKRVPAHVIGDGINNIEELVRIKNLNKLRGMGYKLPLEKIKLGVIEKDFLAKHSRDVSFVPEKDETVFLRKNSNVSTGGDTFDVTCEMNQKYIDIAIEATKSLGLKVCGLDIIIPNINEFGQYTILEMNWNPAIHIHTFPLVGEDRKPAQAMVELVRKYDRS